MCSLKTRGTTPTQTQEEKSMRISKISSGKISALCFCIARPTITEFGALSRESTFKISWCRRNALTRSIIGILRPGDLGKLKKKPAMVPGLRLGIALTVLPLFSEDAVRVLYLLRQTRISSQARY